MVAKQSVCVCVEEVPVPSKLMGQRIVCICSDPILLSQIKKKKGVCEERIEI